MQAIFKAFVAERRGATAIEYGVIVAVLSLAIVASIQHTHNELSDMFVRIAGRFANGT